MDDGKQEKRFPLIYFWLKDYYYQQEPNRFLETNWSYSDESIPISQDKELQEKFKASPPDVVGLSMYLWNEDLLLENARWIKEHYPDTLIVASGPNADASVEFLTKNWFIDLVILGPGAEVFRRIVDARLDGKDYRNVDGVSYLDENRIVKNKPVPRNQDPLILDYVNNFNNEVRHLLDQYFERYSAVIFPTIFIQGCPYSCSFCEQGTSLWTKINKRNIESLYSEIDLLVDYPDVIYEFADANFGIVPDYEKILDYIIENSESGKFRMKRPPMAKNNVDVTYNLIDKMIKNKLLDTKNYGYIALQDTNPEILKLNGRPPSKEFEKIEKFKEFTKDQPHKVNRVDIILGMPGQSFSSISKTIADVLKHELLSNDLPHFYTVFPNTTLTSSKNKINYKVNQVYVRSSEGFNTSFIDDPRNDSSVSFKYLIETDTITSSELINSYYMYALISHVYGFLGWLRTPLDYLKNYYGITSSQFVEKFTSSFHPDSEHNLPQCMQEDLKSVQRWFTGKDKFLQRKDIRDSNYLGPRKISMYRFHSNYDEVSDFFKNIFIELIGHEDPTLDAIMIWQGAKTLKLGDSKYSHKIVSYNYDDVVCAIEQQKYYKSEFEFVFASTDLDYIYDQLVNLEEVSYIANNIMVNEINAEDQVELDITDLKNTVKTLKS